MLSANAPVPLSESFELGEATMLWFAAAAGDDLRVMYIAACGIDVRAADYDNRSALHLAASNGHFSTTLYLLALGADIHFKDRHGSTAVDDARREGHDGVLELLLSYQKALKEAGMTIGVGKNLVPRCSPAEAIILYLNKIRDFNSSESDPSSSGLGAAAASGDGGTKKAETAGSKRPPVAVIQLDKRKRMVIPKVQNSRPLLNSVIHWCDNASTSPSSKANSSANTSTTPRTADDMATLLAARMACKLGGSSASTSASVYVSASGAADQTSGTAADIGWKALQQPEASRAALLQLLRDRGLSSANGHWLWTCR
jgi:hypothetical protein